MPSPTDHPLGEQLQHDRHRPIDASLLHRMMAGASKRINSPAALLFAYVLLAGFCIFYIPTRLSSPPTVSSSYVFGYSNRAGVLLLLLFAGGFGLIVKRAGYRFAPEGRSDRVGGATFLSCLVAMALTCSVLYLLTARSGSFGEAAYMVNRIGLGAKGLLPYRDFEFAYGAALLYGPLFLGRLLGIGFVNGYYLFWLINCVGGLWLLRLLIEAIDLPGIRRNRIFLIFAALFLVAAITTGTNYAPLRFLVAPVLMLGMHRLLTRGRERWAAAWCVVSSLALLLISPEFALEFIVGTLAHLIFFWSRRHSWRWIAPFSVASLCNACLFVLANRLGVFITLKSFAQGGNSLPIVPAIHILFLMFCVLLCASYLVSAFSRQESSNTTLLILGALVGLPSALGRCDPGHVILNGIVLVIVTFLWASHRTLRWRALQTVFAVIFVICSGMFLVGYLGQLWRASLVARMRVQPAAQSAILENYRKSLSVRLGDEVAGEKVAQVRLMESYDSIHPSAWHPPYASNTVLAPFGYPFIQDRTFIDEGYYSGIVNVFDPDQIAYKLNELKRHPDQDVLIPKGASCMPDVQGQQKALSILLFYPFRWRAVHPENLYDPICNFISSNYVVRKASDPETLGFTLWTPKKQQVISTLR